MRSMGSACPARRRAALLASISLLLLFVLGCGTGAIEETLTSWNLRNDPDAAAKMESFESFTLAGATLAEDFPSERALFAAVSPEFDKAKAMEDPDRRSPVAEFATVAVDEMNDDNRRHDIGSADIRLVLEYDWASGEISGDCEIHYKTTWEQPLEASSKARSGSVDRTFRGKVTGQVAEPGENPATGAKVQLRITGTRESVDMTNWERGVTDTDKRTVEWVYLPTFTVVR